MCVYMRINFIRVSTCMGMCKSQSSVALSNCNLMCRTTCACITNMYIDICIYMGFFVCVFLCTRGGAVVPTSTHGVNKCICVHALVQMYLCYLWLIDDYLHINSPLKYARSISVYMCVDMRNNFIRVSTCMCMCKSQSSVALSTCNLMLYYCLLGL